MAENSDDFEDDGGEGSRTREGGICDCRGRPGNFNGPENAKGRL